MKDANKSGKIAPEHAETEDEGIARIVPTAEEYNENLKESIEGKSKLIKYEELINIAPDFAIWLKSMVRYGNVDSQVLIFWKINHDGDENRFNVRFYTDTHIYSISGYEPIDSNPKGYLGCTSSTRKARVGEDWNRGNDLPDGGYSKETFDKIVRGIVAYELKSLQLWRK